MFEPKYHYPRLGDGFTKGIRVYQQAGSQKPQVAALLFSMLLGGCRQNRPLNGGSAPRRICRAKRVGWNTSPTNPDLPALLGRTPKPPFRRRFWWDLPSRRRSHPIKPTGRSGARFWSTRDPAAKPSSKRGYGFERSTSGGLAEGIARLIANGLDGTRPQRTHLGDGDRSVLAGGANVQVGATPAACERGG